MSESSGLLEMASVALDEAIRQLQEVQERCRMARVNIMQAKKAVGETTE